MNPYPFTPPVRPTSGYAVASMICGIVGFMLCFLVIPSIAAVILGHLALRDTANGVRPGHAQAVAGLVLGYAVVGIAVLWVTLAELPTST